VQEKAAIEKKLNGTSSILVLTYGEFKKKFEKEFLLVENLTINKEQNS